MKKLTTLLIFSLLSIGLMAQTNGLQIKKNKKEIESISKLKKTTKAKYDLNKIGGQEKAPAKQIHYEWNNGWEFYYNSSISYYSDGRIKSEILKDELGNEISRINYSYDNQNRLREISSDLLYNNVWKPYSSTIIDYNDQGDLLKYEDRYWNNNQWLILYGQQFEVEYDKNNEVKTIIESNYNGNKYDTTEKRVEYRTNNILTLEETYFFDGYNTFIPIDQYEYLYDDAGVDTGMLKKIWVGSEWQEDLLFCNYGWDNPGKDFLSFNNVFIKIGESWKLYERETYSRDNYGSFYYLLERYMNGLWVGDMRISSINDNYKSRVAYIYDLYLGGSWLQLFKIEEEYIYDMEGNILEHVYKESDSNGEMQNIYKNIYSDYALLLGLNIKKTINLNIYPNPASKYIKVSGAKAGRKYKITTPAGLTVLAGILNEFLTIELDNINPGAYILTIDSFQGKFLVSK